VIWTLLGSLVLALALALLSLRLRRAEQRRVRDGLRQIAQARQKGSHKARLQYPNVDLSRCLGCGTCIAACPEDGVLELIHGQAVVVHGARCVGHGLCAEACPVGAIDVTLGDMSSRRDIPALTPEWEVTGVPGLFLAGEVTGYALIRTAITHGSAIADVVHKRLEASGRRAGAVATGARKTHDSRDASDRHAARAVSGRIETPEPREEAARPAPRPATWQPAHDARRAPHEPGLLVLGAVGPTASFETALDAASGSAATLAPESPAIGSPAPASPAPAVGRDAVGLPGLTAEEQRLLALPSEQDAPERRDELLDLLIVGSGPAGLACSLRAKQLGLDFRTLEQEHRTGGTVAKYPRRKLVMTQPVDLPLHGRLSRTTYTKEELITLWDEVSRQHELPIETAQTFESLERDGDVLVVRTQRSRFRARHVCLALGRRGSPRRLGVPGEDLPKVVYSLQDAQSYSGRRVLVVGGGDSAVEAALGLCEQPGNTVTLSYRKQAFFRLKARNEEALQAAVSGGRLALLMQSEVTAITPDEVHLARQDEQGAHEVLLPNDEVFILAGGTPPFELLERSGVSFDPEDRPPPPPLVEQGTGLLVALLISLALTIVFAGWYGHFQDYYDLPRHLRFNSPRHEVLRSSGPLGLGAGIAATSLIVLNLLYLLRRARFGAWLPGSLKLWMTSHVVTGILALLLVLVHGAMDPNHSLGGHAFAALAVLVGTGAVGRYFYAFVPHAANGREIALDEVRAALTDLSAEWDQQTRGFGTRVRQEIEGLVDEGQWSRSFVRRLVELVRSQRRLNHCLARLRAEARAEGLQPDQLARLAAISRKAHRTALMAAHYEDLRALLGTWRFIHRWFALLMVMLATWHIATALKYAGIFA